MVQDIHQVIARREIEFETTYKEQAAQLNDDDCRLLMFAWAPHGGGEGYEAVTLMSFSGSAALGRHQERIRYGDLGQWWTSTESMRYGLHSSTHVLESPPLETKESDSEPRLFRLDRLALRVPLIELRNELPTGAAPVTDDGVLDVLGWWTPFFGDLEEPSLTVLNRVRSDDAFLEAFRHLDRPWTGSLEPSGAVREEARLLRSVPWSPVG